MLSLAGFFALRGELEADAARDFEQRARSRLGVLQDGLLDFVEVQWAVATFISLAEIDADKFRLYANAVYKRHPGLDAWGWLPRVPASERRSFEAAARAGGDPGFRILEPSVPGDVGGDVVEAAERPEYFPVLYAERRVGGPQRLGWDMGPDPERGTALRRAIDTGEVTATHSTQIVGVAGRKTGLVLFAPVYDTAIAPHGLDARRAAAKGVVSGAVILGEAVESILSPSGTNSGVDLYLYEGTATDDEHLLYFRPSGSSAEGAARAALRGAEVTAGTYRTFPLKLADANFTVLARPSPGAEARLQNRLPSAALLAGIAITGLLAWRVSAMERDLASRALLAAIVDSSGDAIIGKDLAGTITSWNPGAQHMYGYRAEEMIGRNVRVLVPEERSDEIVEILARLARGERVDHRESERVRKDGSRLVVSFSASPIRDSAGKVVGASTIARDITERRRAEEELARYRGHLEELVAARTAELAEANALLEAGNKELEAFSYSVSHDLRTPLRAIDGFARILLEDHAEKLDAEGRRVLKVVCDNTKKMGQLIDDMLAFSRMGRQEMSVAAVDMERVVREAIEELEPAGAGRDIAFKIAPLPTLNGDPAMLRRVLVNLIDNAVKFTTPKPKAVIEVGARPDGHEFVFSVKDNGVGFDMQYVGKLFGMFQRLHGAAEFPGTGIGLAIVKRIVSRHGGRVWAEGKPGEGAIFFFTLPIMEKSNA